MKDDCIFCKLANGVFETNKIYGVLKISSDSFDEYILYCKVNGRITENRIYTKKDLYV